VAGRIAVVDLGTNSTRLLVADVRHGQVDEVERQTAVTRLGEGVDGSGHLADAAMERVFAALREYRQLIDRHGTERVVARATASTHARSPARTSHA
jgi:exopolyphosphatase/guanosine-5'-triphosphate,3'-diphosphate pyrophosphatase